MKEGKIGEAVPGAGHKGVLDASGDDLTGLSLLQWCTQINKIIGF